MAKQLLAICAVLAICCMQSANAISCYQCSSLMDANCQNDVIDANSNIRVVDCATAPKPNSGEDYLPVTKCNKMTTSDRISRIASRGCHFEVLGQKADECRVSDNRSVDNCFTCSGNLCNADTTKKSSTSGAAAASAAVAALLAACAMRLAL